MNYKNRILILFAHPFYERSRVNLGIAKEIREEPFLTFFDLYEHYADFMIDVKSEQQRLLEYDVIVFQHPFYWYSCPALLKEWIDRVLERGFAYGEGGTALKGKKLLSAITAGGKEDAYSKSGHNNFEIKEFLRPFEQTANLCHMEYLDPFITHGTWQLTETQIQERALEYQRLIFDLAKGE